LAANLISKKEGGFCKRGLKTNSERENETKGGKGEPQGRVLISGHQRAGKGKGRCPHTPQNAAETARLGGERGEEGQGAWVDQILLKKRKDAKTGFGPRRETPCHLIYGPKITK